MIGIYLSLYTESFLLLMLRLYMKISVSIVDYNKGPRLLGTLKCLDSQSISKFMDVIVIDNSPNDSNHKCYSDFAKACSLSVKIFRPRKNIGYTVATNSSVDVLSDYVVILNPDVHLTNPSTIEYCIEYLNLNSHVGIVGIQQQDDLGKIELVSRSYPDLITQISRRGGPLLKDIFKDRIKNYENLNANTNEQPVEVDWLQSSFWVMKTSLWNSVGGLCSDYFLFMSEPEFSFKVKKLGFDIVLLPNVVAFSDGVRCSGGGFSSIFKSKTVRSHIIDASRYYLKRLYGKFN